MWSTHTYRMGSREDGVSEASRVPGPCAMLYRCGFEPRAVRLQSQRSSSCRWWGTSLPHLPVKRLLSSLGETSCSLVDESGRRLGEHSRRLSTASNPLPPGICPQRPPPTPNSNVSKNVCASVGFSGSALISAGEDGAWGRIRTKKNLGVLPPRSQFSSSHSAHPQLTPFRRAETCDLAGVGTGRGQPPPRCH